MRTRFTALTCAALVVALATVAACSGQPSGKQETPSIRQAPETTGGPSGDTTLDSSEESPTAQTIVEGQCTVCHTIDRVDAAEKDWAGWDTAVAHMIDNGAKLTPEERKAVVDYLDERK